MFLLFRHKAKQKQDRENDVQDRIANSIVHKCIRAQERCATFMQHQTEKLSSSIKKVLLVMFFISSGGYSLYLFVESLKTNKGKFFSVTPIKVPGYMDKSGDENTKTPVIVSKDEYERIHCFKLYIDSLALNSSGRRLYDSILFSRPGLMDSIMIIEEMSKAKN